jgi:pimeloyl-ACP methyl ester carboxylesterase
MTAVPATRPTESVPAPKADGQFDALYDRAAEELLAVPVEERWVNTRTGRTHVLLAGDPEAPPVLVLQGGNVTNPVTLSWFQDLADEYRLVAPDTPGEPGKSMAVAPGEYGPWVVDTLDALGLETVAMVGPSHGAGVLLEAAVEAPERVAAAVLVVPAGFGTPLSPALAGVVLPALVYRLRPSEWLLKRALAPMFTDPPSAVEDVVLETVGLALRTGDPKAEFPGPSGPDALARFDAPTLVVTAEADPFFPGERTAERAAAWLPSLSESVLLAGERHFLSPRGRRTVTGYARSFLAEHYAVDRSSRGATTTTNR